ncbi:hypothetical protein MRB53_041702 [Persea americana]|nr:hypothetical protein MRB53_041702 [Persea americana]
MEAIERCLDLLDDETMTALQPRLDAAMKGAVGLPSKVGASRILVSLATRRTQIFKTSADHFLKLIEKLVLDRNETVSSSYAAAAGYVARHASDKQILRFVTFIKSLYFKSEGDREGSVPRRRFNAIAASILPLVFFAKHDPHEAVKAQSQNTWSEAVGGNRAVQLYLTEILDLVKESLVSPQWTLKHTAARTIADAINSICASEKQLSRATSTALWPVLDNALTCDCEGERSRHAESAQLTRALRYRFARRSGTMQNIDSHSIKSLAQIAAIRTDIDVSEEVHQIVVPIIQEIQDQDVMDIDVETNKSQKPAEELLSCFRVIPRQASNNLWHRAYSKRVCEGLKQFFDNIEHSATKDEPNLANMSEAIRNLLFGLDAGSEATRQLRAETVLQIFKSSVSLATTLRESVVESKEHERSIRVRDLLAACLALHTSGHGS